MSIITLVDLTTNNDSYSAGGLTTLLPVYHSDVDDDDVVNVDLTENDVDHDDVINIKNDIIHHVKLFVVNLNFCLW